MFMTESSGLGACYLFRSPLIPHHNLCGYGIAVINRTQPWTLIWVHIMTLLLTF